MDDGFEDDYYSGDVCRMCGVNDVMENGLCELCYGDQEELENDRLKGKANGSETTTSKE